MRAVVMQVKRCAKHRARSPSSWRLRYRSAESTVSKDKEYLTN